MLISAILVTASVLVIGFVVRKKKKNEVIGATLGPRSGGRGKTRS